MKRNRLSLVFLLGAMALLATGCEWARWLRLLSMKKQFAQLERYVRAEDTNGLTLHFVKPVVYADDLRLLVQDETLHSTNQNRQTWLWTYEKQSLEPQQAGDFDLSFTASFENLKFTELHFPERFLAVLPKPMILGMLRSIGLADVDMKHGTVKFKWAGSEKEKIDLPAKSHVLELLGPPFITIESNLTRTFLYKYYQKTPTPQSPADRLAWAKFTFVGDSARIVSSEGNIGNMGWTMSTVPGQSEMHITVSLTALSVEPVALHLPAEVTDEYIGQYREADGTVFNIGRDGEAFAASWDDGKHGGWCAALPETTNTLFALPAGDPHCVFLRDHHGAITGLVAHLGGSDRSFSKVPSQPSLPPVVEVAAETTAACAGTYKASWGGRIIIGLQDGHLFWRNPGIGLKLPLYAASETNYFFKVVESPLTFVKNDKGNVTKFVLHYCGRTAEAEKLKNP